MPKSFRKHFEEKYLDTYQKRLVFVIICLSLVALYIGWQIVETSGPRPRRSEYRVLGAGVAGQLRTAGSVATIPIATGPAEQSVTRR